MANVAGRAEMASNVTGTKGGGAGGLARLCALGSATGGLSTRVSAATAVATGSCLGSARVPETRESATGTAGLARSAELLFEPPDIVPQPPTARAATPNSRPIHRIRGSRAQRLSLLWSESSALSHASSRSHTARM